MSVVIDKIENACFKYLFNNSMTRIFIENNINYQNTNKKEFRGAILVKNGGFFTISYSSIYRELSI